MKKSEMDLMVLSGNDCMETAREWIRERKCDEDVLIGFLSCLLGMSEDSVWELLDLDQKTS